MICEEIKDSSFSACSIPGCDGNSSYKAQGAKGYCSLHYQRLRKHGDPLYEPSERFCSVDGCEKPHFSNGYCGMHRHRWAKYGDPLGGPTFRVKNQGEICKVEGCDNPARTIGLCNSHHHRYMRYGDPLGGGTYHGEPWDWIEKHKSHQGNECLIWPFHVNSDGYGYVTTKDTRKSISASRFMCEQVYGSPPTSEHEVAHNCGKGHEGCVNPKHLRWATKTENMMDKVLHGTSPRGENSPTAKLTREQVREIRRLKGIWLQEELAKRFGVTNSAISAIQVGRTWFWLD